MTASPSAGKSTTIAALEERGLDYILGARERGSAVIREVVLKSEKAVHAAPDARNKAGVNRRSFR